MDKVKIAGAGKRGELAAVIILSHGSPTEGLLLSKDSNGFEKRINGSENYSKCFSGVQKQGTIVLMGGSLGQKVEGKENIAEKIADEAQRTVLATTCPIYQRSTTLQSLDPLLLEHSGYSYLWNFLWDALKIMKTFLRSWSLKVIWKGKINHENC